MVLIIIKLKKLILWMSLFRPRKPFMSTFRISYFPHFAAWKVAGFVSKSYGFRAQELWSSPARAMAFEAKSYGLRGEKLLLSTPRPISLTYSYLWADARKHFRSEKTQINLVFRSLIRTFELTLEGTSVRKNSNKFGFSLTYSYLWSSARRYFRSEKLK